MNTDKRAAAGSRMLGQGSAFDGADDYVNVRDAAVFDFTVSGKYTWSF